MPANPAIHPSADVLQSLNLGKLDNETAQKVVRHLDDCPACRQAIAGLSGDSFLDRLRDAHDGSGTNIPAKALPRSAKGSPAGRPDDSLPPAVAALPPELADSTQYHVVRELGRGGMGVVYLAKNVLLDRPEVLKVLNKAVLDTPAAAERFLREIRSAAKLSHDNVVKAHSALALGELLVFAMEYVEGEDLTKVVKRQGPLPVARACFYAYQVALGLQHAHEHGLVHRDIKPQNVILSHQEKKHLVKVLDFGLAKATREGKADTGLTGAGVVLGTPDYIAPEQAMDAANADIRADVYSLGCTLYFLLTGAPPFQGKSLMEVLQGHLLQEARPLNQVRDEVPAELAAVVAKMMAKEPAQRYQKPIEVAQALVPFVKAGAKPVPTGATEAVTESPGKGARAGQPRPAETAPVWAGMVTEGSAIVAKARKQTAAQPAGKKGRVVALAAVALALALLVPLVCWLVIVMLRVETPNGTLIVEMNDDLEARIKNGKLILSGPDGKVRYTLAASERNKKLEAGPYKIRVEGADGLLLDTPEFTIRKGHQVIVRVTLEPKDPPDKPDMAKTVTADAAWLKEVAALPAAQQVQAVAIKLKKLNPGFAGPLSPTIEGGVVTELQFPCEKVKDISPLRAMLGLRSFWYDHGPLANLSPLKNMRLERLHCWNSQVSDLSPLKGMPLTNLICGQSRVADLSPLKDMKLTVLQCQDTSVSDLSPLKGMPLTHLICHSTQVTDLTPLKGLPLTNFCCLRTRVSDLTPLKDMKLTEVDVSSTGVSDLSPLKDMKLTDLWCLDTGVSDLTPLKNMKLTRLCCQRSQVTGADLAPLQGMSSLRWLEIGGQKMTDAGLEHLQKLTALEYLSVYNSKLTGAGLVHLKGMTRLQRLCLYNTELTDAGLVHLKDLLGLRDLDLRQTRVTDAGLEHLAGLKNLAQLWLGLTAVTDKGVAKLKAALPNCNISRAGL